MKTELALIMLLTLAGVALYNQEGLDLNQSPSEKNVYQAYVQWKAQYNQNTNGAEDDYRFSVFSENFNFIEQHNIQDSELTLAINQFAAMTNDEFRNTYLTEIMQNSDDELERSDLSAADLPTQVDWTTKGAVAPVQNQGSCGACWAFSTVAGLESLEFNQNGGNLVKLSEQQVLSCIPFPFSLGCKGGNAIFGYTYTSIAGIETEEAYAYTDIKAKVASACEYEKSEVVFQNKGVKLVEPENPQALQAAVAQQVVSVSVDASSVYFQFYRQGVLSSSKCGTDLNHAITAVGYNMDASEPYWIVRNSWGADWGQKGYVNIAVTQGAGVCGINLDSTYPY